MDGNHEVLRQNDKHIVSKLLCSFLVLEYTHKGFYLQNIQGKLYFVDKYTYAV
jgi:hypothetical protein